MQNKQSQMLQHGQIMGFTMQSWQQQSSLELIQQNKKEDDHSFINQFIVSQIKTQAQKPFQEQIQELQIQIMRLDENKEITDDQKQYTKSQMKKQVVQILTSTNQVYQIIMPSINQKIEKDNPELMLYVLKESLLRDQNRELFMTQEQHSFGIDSIIGVYGQNYDCLRFKTTDIQYDKLMNDIVYRNECLTKFKENFAQQYQIKTSDIQILDIKQGSTIIIFRINDNTCNEKITESGFKDFKFCKGQLELCNYFLGIQNKGLQQIALSYGDFDNKFDMNWNYFPEYQFRGPPEQRYTYYFPKGCYGFGLKIKKYKEDPNQNWIKMDGNKDEWRIMYHGTKQNFVKQIIKTELNPGWRNIYENENCLDENGNYVKVGIGIYFSDQIKVCLDEGYAEPININGKKFSAIFMTRVNPKKMRQSQSMKAKRYFLVNNSQDVRPYRLLIYEWK